MRPKKVVYHDKLIDPLKANIKKDLTVKVKSEVDKGKVKKKTVKLNVSVVHKGKK